MRGSRRRLCAGLAVLAAAIGLTACGSGSEGGKQLFRVGAIAKLDTLNPFTSIEDLATGVLAQVYPVLIEPTPTGGLRPALASSWSISPDGRTYTLKLRKGEWSDGTPVTSADVVWTIETLKKFVNGPTGRFSGTVEGIKRISAPDPETVVVEFTQPTGTALVELALFYVLPKHVWQSHVGSDGKGLQQFDNAKHMVAGGPFRVARFQKGTSLLLQRNPGFYGTKPKVDRIGFSFYSNPDALVSALKSNEVDAAASVPVASATTLRAGKLVVSTSPGIGQMMLGINSNAKRTQHPELRDPRVREAFDDAIDRKGIVQTAFLGYAQQAGAMVPAALSRYHAPIAPTTFDVAAANALLDQAGFKRGSDGIRRANGAPMSYEVIQIDNPGGGEGPAFDIMSRAFKQIGVRLKLRLLDGAAALQTIFGKNGTSYDGADMILVTIVGTMDPGDILSFNTCQALGTYNLPGFCDQRYDALYKQQRLTTDVGKRAAIVIEMQRLLATERPYLVLTYNEELSSHAAAWSGFEYTPSGWLTSTYTTTHVHTGG